MPNKPPKHQPLPKRSNVHIQANAQSNYGKGRGGRPWRRVREQVLRRDGYLCQCAVCQHGNALPLLADEVDHIIPLAQGGSNKMSNLQAMNHSHHRIKTRKEIAERLNKNK